MSTYTDFLAEMKAVTENIPSFPKSSSPAVQYFQYWKDELFKKDELFVEKYQKIVDAEKTEMEASGAKAPFLSVVIRTQGKRSEMLRETFLALYGQSDDDFEVILIKHKAQPQDDAMVEEIIAEQPESLRRRIRSFALNEGNRTAPINEGLAHTRGEYMVILDDDDIVFDHWVESFHKAAKRDAGCILHGYVVEQKWEILDEGDGKIALRAAGTPDDVFCCDYNYVEQSRQNRCPLMGLAFPGFLFREYGKVFDESLTTTEDWDYLMRFSYLLGVSDIKTPVAVYRRFENAVNANTMHKESEWNRNYASIIEKYRPMPKVLTTAEWQDYMVKNRGIPKSDPGKGEPQHFDWATLYPDYGEGYAEENIIRRNILNTASVFDVDFQLDHITKTMEHLRIDITEGGLFGVCDMYFVIEYMDGTVFRGDQDDFLYTNGCEYTWKGSKGIWFEGTDPQIELPLKKGSLIRSVHFYGWRTHYLPVKELLNRTDDGCICPFFVQNYQGIYDAYLKRIRYFRNCITEEKKEEKRTGESREENIKNLRKNIKTYARYVENAIEKDIAWSHGHSRLGIVRMNRMKMRFIRENPRR